MGCDRTTFLWQTGTYLPDQLADNHWFCHIGLSQTFGADRSVHQTQLQVGQKDIKISLLWQEMQSRSPNHFSSLFHKMTKMYRTQYMHGKSEEIWLSLHPGDLQWNWLKWHSTVPWLQVQSRVYQQRVLGIQLSQHNNISVNGLYLNFPMASLATFKNVQDPCISFFMVRWKQTWSNAMVSWG